MSRNSEELALFTRRMSILIEAGFPVLRALRVIESDTGDVALKNAIVGVIDDIECGAVLNEGFAKYPEIFSGAYVNMVKAGEAGDHLKVIFQRLVEYFDKPCSDGLADSLRLLGMLIGSGVPILEALELVCDVCTEKYKVMYQNALDAVRQGESLAVPLQESGILSAVVVNLVDVGEETGELETILYKAADFLEYEARRKQN